MKHIILKDLFLQRSLLIGGGIGMLVAALLPGSLGLGILLMPHSVIVLIVMVLGATMTESAEEKNYGYVFLSTLPISRLNIVAAKFLVVLLECTTFSLASWVILSMKSLAESLPVGVETLIGLSFSTCIVIGSFVNFGAYTLGMKNFTRVMVVGSIGVQLYIFSLGLQSWAGGNSLTNLLQLLQWVLVQSPLWVISAGLAVWSLLSIVTAQFRKRI
jgi:ABC-type transport system involved in multi-copper enzyme maturation permease subunit